MSERKHSVDTEDTMRGEAPDSGEETPLFCEADIPEEAVNQSREEEEPGAEAESDIEADGQPEDAGEEEEISVEEELAALDPETYSELKSRAQERDLYLEELLRAKAELDNFRKRMRRDRQTWENHAVRHFLNAILPVFDNFERAIGCTPDSGSESDNFRKGLQMIDALLQQTLTDYGVEEIETEGKTFDPEVHEAVAAEAVRDREPGEILEVQQKGYMYKAVVVRPSRVKVARKIEETDQED